jgi:hypothetical protein
MSKRLDPFVVRLQINNLLLAHPELAEDEILRADMIQGETDAFELLDQILAHINEAAILAGGTATVVSDLEARLKRYERRQAALRELAFKVMQAADLKKAERPAATLSVRAGTPKVLITAASELPADCVRTYFEANRVAIKERLTAGQDVPGAVLSNGEATLSIRIK